MKLNTIGKGLRFILVAITLLSQLSLQVIFADSNVSDDGNLLYSPGFETIMRGNWYEDFEIHNDPDYQGNKFYFTTQNDVAHSENKAAKHRAAKLTLTKEHAVSFRMEEWIPVDAEKTYYFEVWAKSQGLSVSNDNFRISITQYKKKDDWESYTIPTTTDYDFAVGADDWSKLSGDVSLNPDCKYIWFNVYAGAQDFDYIYFDDFYFGLAENKGSIQYERSIVEQDAIDRAEHPTIVLDAVVDVKESEVVRTADARMLGFNVEWKNNWRNVLLDTDTNKINQDYINAAQDSIGIGHINLARAAGDSSKEFEWEDSIGPMETRPKKRINLYRPTGEDKDKEAILYGVDEWVKAIEAVDTDTEFVIVLKMSPYTDHDSSGLSDEKLKEEEDRLVKNSKNLAEYLVGDVSTEYGRKRIENGRTEPVNITLYELGNELYYNIPDVDHYIALCKEHIASVRLADPNAKFAAIASWDWDEEKNDDEWREWHIAVLKELGNDIDFLTVHPYYVPPFMDDHYKYINTVSADIDAYYRELAENNADFEPKPNGDRIKFLISEHGIWPVKANGGNRAYWFNTTNLYGSLGVAEFLTNMFNRTDVYATALHGLNEGHELWSAIKYDLGGDTRYASGVAYMMGLFNESLGETVAASSSKINDIAGLAYEYWILGNTLGTLAMQRSDGGLNVIMVNGNPYITYDVALNFEKKYNMSSYTVFTAGGINYDNFDNKENVFETNEIENHVEDIHSFRMPEKSMVVLHLDRQKSDLMQSIQPYGNHVPTNGTLSVTFEEPMNPDVVGKAVFAPNEGVNLTNGRWNYDNTQYLWDMTGLKHSTLYTVVVTGFENMGSTPMLMNAYTHTFKTETAPSQFTVTVSSSGNGMATASPALAYSGTVIHLTASAETGYHFKEWRIEQGAITDLDLMLKNASFTMPGESVTVRAVFEADIIPPDSTNSKSSDSNSSANSYVTIPTYKIVKLKYMNDNTITSFDTTNLSMTEGVMTLSSSKKDDGYVWFFTLERLKEMETANKKGKYKLVVPGLEYNLPFDMTDIITGLSAYISDNNMSSKDLSLELTVRNLIGNDLEKAEIAYKKAFPDGEVVSDFYDINFAIYKDGRKIGVDTNHFNKSMTFAIETMGKANSALVYDQMTKKITFVPAKFKNDTATIETLHHSVYVAAKNNVSFDDVQTGAWYTPYVINAANRALITGVGNNLYQPEKEVTRAEFVQMVVNAVQLSKAETNTEAYYDVAGDSWYYSAIIQAKSAGLLDKFTDTGFYPNQAITREEMSTILAAVISQSNAAIAKEKIHLNQLFTDYDSIDSIYINDIELVYRTKIMKGIGNGIFDPKGVTTRAQAATVLINLLKTLSIIN